MSESANSWAQRATEELRAAGYRAGAARRQVIGFGDGVARFEAIRGDHSHHHHLVCDECGKVETFSDERLERALRDVESKSGYAVAAHDVVLRGACTACADN